MWLLYSRVANYGNRKEKPPPRIRYNNYREYATNDAINTKTVIKWLAAKFICKFIERESNASIA